MARLITVIITIIFCVCITSTVFGYESSYRLNDGKESRPNLITSFHHIREEVVRHEKSRDDALRKMNNAKKEHVREYWLMAAIKEEGSRLLALIKAVNGINQRMSQERKKSEHNYSLSDPAVSQEIEGLRLMLQKGEQLAAVNEMEGNANHAGAYKQASVTLDMLVSLLSAESSAQLSSTIQRKAREQLQLIGRKYVDLKSHFENIISTRKVT